MRVVRTHLGNERPYSRIKQVPRVAAVPLAILVVKVGARQVAGDGRDGEVRVSALLTLPVGERVVLDPLGLARRSLWTQIANKQKNCRRIQVKRTNRRELPSRQDLRDRLGD